MDIGQKLKKARQQAGLTQEAVADAIGVSRQTLSAWENNRSYPDIVSVLQLSEVYGVSLDELLKEAEDMKKQEQSQIDFLEKYWNAIYNAAVLMFPLSRLCEYYGMDSMALILLVFGAGLFCLPRLLFHRLFGGGLKNVALGILGWCLAGGSYALRVVQGESTALCLAMFLSGLFLVIWVRHKEWSGPDHWSKWAVVAMIALATAMPMFDLVIAPGGTSAAAPFPHTYRVAEVLHGEHDGETMVDINAYGNFYLLSPSTWDLTELGGLTEQKTAAGEQSETLAGIWQIVPENDAGALYRVTVDTEGTVCAAYFRDDILQWKYRLSLVDTLRVSASSGGSRTFFISRWFPAGAFDGYTGSLEDIDIHGSGGIGFSWVDERTQELTVTEEYYHDGEVEVREYHLPADDLGLDLETRYDTGDQYAIYRIPYEGGEYVFQVNFQ